MRKIIFIAISFVAIHTTACNNYGLVDKFQNPGGGSFELKSHYIFVSSMPANASMNNLTNGGCTGGGMLQADCSCRDMAKAAGLPGSDGYMAWLSIGSNDALCRVQNITSPLVACSPNSPTAWYNRKNELLAASVGELISGNLKAAVRYTQNGIETGDVEVFTGTNAPGNSGSTCSDWTNAASVTMGDPRATTGDWTQKPTPVACGGLQRPIYCIRKIF